MLPLCYYHCVVRETYKIWEHDPTVVTRALWARWKSLGETLKNPEMKGIII
jgi:hypothetical protein